MGISLAEPPLPENPDADFDESREVLARYVEWVGYFLMMMVEYRNAAEEDGIPYFEPKLTDPLVDAWLEFRDQGHIERVAALLRDPADLEALQRALLDNGLTGRQLTMKTTATHYYSTGLAGFWNRRARAVLSRLLATVNSLLKSIMKAVPGGAAIDEFKQIVENIRFIEDEGGSL